MTDIIDQANDLIEREMQARLASRRNTMLPPTGECYNCAEPVIENRRFCDAECRDEYDRRARREKKPA